MHNQVTPEGETFTLHCADTGAMTGCATPGDTVWYSTSDNPKRKYAHSWELTETICVNTLRANHLVHEALLAHRIPELAGYRQITPEVKYGTENSRMENSRIDLLLQAPGQINCYMR